MDFISKYLLRAAGLLVAAQIFLTFGLPGDDWVTKVTVAGTYAMFPVPFFVLGGFLTAETSLREVGFTILLWAGAGAIFFFGSVYGDPDVDRIPYVPVPAAHDVSLGFGFANLVVVVLTGIGVWLWGLKSEAAPGTYYSVG